MLRLISAAIVIAGVVVPAVLHAVVWAEMGDAGPLLGSAQEPVGNGVLTEISGTISRLQTDVPENDLSAFGASDADVDLYKIFISDPSAFSADTINGDAIDSDLEFDAQLALFDASGLGVYANDDRAVDDGDAMLPAANAFSPTQPGIYYLAIFDDNVTPISALTLSGPIFPDGVFPFTAVVAATGPGGGQPLLDWFPDAPIDADRMYSILLTGVTVPEPHALAQAAAALATMVCLSSARRRMRS